MSDNEIIKTLECCQSNSCNGCPFEGYNVCLRGLPRVALDLIKRQKVEIEGLKIANEHMYAAFKQRTAWISVEDRLPSEEERRDESGELVPFLVCENGTDYPYRAVYDGNSWGDGFFKIDSITHWMPLPEPPKADKAKTKGE